MLREHCGMKCGRLSLLEGFVLGRNFGIFFFNTKKGRTSIKKKNLSTKKKKKKGEPRNLVNLTAYTPFFACP